MDTSNSMADLQRALEQRSISDGEIYAAVMACRRALANLKDLYPSLGLEHHTAYALAPSVTRGRPSLIVVTVTGEACVLTADLLANMAEDEDSTGAWYGPVPIILRVEPGGDRPPDSPLTAIEFSAAPIPPCEGQRHMIKLKGTLRAADGRTLVITRRSPWRCLPHAISPRIP